MTFAATFEVDDAEDDDSLPGRRRVLATMVDGTASGRIVSGHVSLVLASGTDVGAGDVVHVSGWVQSAATLQAEAADGAALPPP